MLEGITIEGPDYIYEMESTAVFTLSKKGYDAEKDYFLNSVTETTENGESVLQFETAVPYATLNYEWKSDNENVAKFVETQNFVQSDSCVRERYPTLIRPNIFSIKAGTATISCTISDDEGNSVILTKKLIVLKGTPIKSVKIGKHKMKKFQRNTTQSYIYSNEYDTKIKVKVKPKKGWGIKYIGVDRKQSGIYKNITKKKRFSLNTSRDVYIKIKLKNKETGQIFEYYCDIVRYSKHTIKLGKLKKGYALVCERTAWSVPLVPRYTVVLKYKKNSKKTDSDTFKSGKDLVRKLKKYYDYTNQTVKYKNGKLIYKETRSLTPWIFCESKGEVKKVLEEFEN